MTPTSGIKDIYERFAVDVSGTVDEGGRHSKISHNTRQGDGHRRFVGEVDAIESFEAVGALFRGCMNIEYGDASAEAGEGGCDGRTEAPEPPSDDYEFAVNVHSLNRDALRSQDVFDVSDGAHRNDVVCREFDAVFAFYGDD